MGVSVCKLVVVGGDVVTIRIVVGRTVGVGIALFAVLSVNTC